MLLLFLLGAPGCPHAPPPVLDYASTPQLPAVDETSYGRQLEPPSDALLRDLLSTRLRETRLSTAAARLALDTHGAELALDAPTLRELLWQAGVPYPLRDARAASVLQGTAPPPPFLEWLEQLPEEVDLGLTRVRKSGYDLWIALVTRPRIVLPDLPRILPSPQEIVLPSLPGCRFVVASPGGDLLAGPMDTARSLPVTEDGEWLIRILDPSGTLALFPVYVGIEPPEDPLFPSVAPTAVSPDAQVFDLLQTARRAYDVPPWDRDPMLDLIARQLFDRPEEELRRTMELQDATVLRCVGLTVTDCLDTLWWVPEHREALVSDRTEWLGLAVRAGRPPDQGTLSVNLVVTGSD